MAFLKFCFNCTRINTKYLITPFQTFRLTWKNFAVPNIQGVILRRYQQLKIQVGASGKAWLACTCTKSRNKTPAICVLKYGNKGSLGLEYEKRMWEILYPEFKGKIKLEMWSGSLALVMPHFCSVTLTDRNMYQESIEALLIERFHSNGYIHQDVRWRNIGFYANDGGNVPILYDLETVRELNDQDDPNWIQVAMVKLFGNLDL